MQTESAPAVYLLRKGDIVPYYNALPVDDDRGRRELIEGVPLGKIELGFHFGNEFVQVFLGRGKKRQIRQSCQRRYRQQISTPPRSCL